VTDPTDQPDPQLHEEVRNAVTHFGSGDDDVERMVLTTLEVARALRLCDPGSTPKENGAAVDVVHRLVQKRKLKPFRPGKAHVFYRAEVARYIREETYE